MQKLPPDVLELLERVAGMILPQHDLITRDDIREKREAAQALLRKYGVR